MTTALVKRNRRETRPARWFGFDNMFDTFFHRWDRFLERFEEVWNTDLVIDDGKATLTFDNFDKFDKDDVKVEYDGEYFTAVASKNKNGISRKVTNTYYLPNVELDSDMDAEFKDGKLVITFPYEGTLAEEEKVKTIDIK